MSAAWTSHPFLAIDTETTGVNCFEDRIVEVAVVDVFADGTTGNDWSTVVDPGVEIPDGAAAVHGITTEQARADGVDPAVAIVTVAQRIHDHHQRWDGHGALVMYNARFDWPLLISEADRHQVDFPAFASILDPYLIDRMCDRYRKGKRQLSLVADHYGVQLTADDAHGALADATAGGRVMHEIVRRYPQIGEHSLASLWLRQVKGHEQDRARFVDYMRRNTDPTFDTAPGWPIPAGVA